MNQNKAYLFLILSIAALLLSIANVKTMTAILSGSGRKSDPATVSQLSETIKQVDRALKATVAGHSIHFDPVARSPFQTYESVPAANQVHGDVTGTKLLLKGILVKNSSPLAIIEDQAGATYIRGAGDKIAEHTIIRINDTSVLLRNSHGSYELTVQE